jgi:recombination protein RecT
MNAVATTEQRSLTIRDRLESDLFKQQIAKVLPKHLSPERMTRVAITATMRVPKLSKCDQTSFFNAMLTLSQLGLEPDGRNAHLIPFENRKANIVECQLIIDYKGFVQLIMQTGLVSRIHADVVRENDEFDYDRGILKSHKPNFRKERGKVFAVYCIIAMKDGTEKCEVMSRDDVEAIRKRSRSGSNGPWVTDWDEMAKKTVFRRASKWVPISSEKMQMALEADDSDVIEGRVTKSTTTISKHDVMQLIGNADPVEPSDYSEELDRATTWAALSNLHERIANDDDLPTDEKESLINEVNARLDIVNAEDKRGA